MNPELMAAANHGDAGFTSEQCLIRLPIAGDVESMRQRLAHALEKFGYFVVSEDTLYARRGACGWAVYDSSANVLDYPTLLTIGLKPLSAGATQATFNYRVKCSMLTDGDLQTLRREAEAIVALALLRAKTATCAGCGAEAVAGSRFCRQCGAPAARGIPAEIEVLRLTSGARAGHHAIGWGACFLALAFLTPLLFFAVSRGAAGLTMAEKGVAVLVLMLSALGWPTLLTGIRRLHRTLNPEPVKREAPAKPQPASVMPQTVEAPPPAAEAPLPATELPPPTAPPSVTESTTDLLPERDEISSPLQEKGMIIPVRRWEDRPVA